MTTRARRSGDPRLDGPSSGDGLGRAEPHFCGFLWTTITILCDGNVTCGLDDPHGVRSFGNVNDASIREIWADDAFRDLRNRLLAGTLCEGCTLFVPVRRHGIVARSDWSDVEQTTPTPLREPEFPYPSRLILEPTITCNLRCDQQVCNVNYGPGFRPRAANHMSFALFERIMDELGPHLTYMYFFNYGDPFMHPRAEDMLALAKRVNPSMEIVTSTNGIPLAKESRARKVVESGIDRIVFTIGGTRQEAYERYHRRGKLELALRGMENVCRAKRELDADTPDVMWRYLTFNWNDSDGEIDEAIAIADDFGVDKLRFHLTREPPGSASIIRAPGQPGHERIRSRVDYAAGYDSVQPSGDGLYRWEHDPVLGSFRWTAARATLRLRATGPRAAVSIATNAPDATPHPPTVTFRGPFGIRRAQPGVRRWHRVELPVPRRLRAGAEFPVTIEVDRPWSPLLVGLSSDERTLGVMVGAVDEPPDAGTARWWRRARPIASDRRACGDSTSA